MRDFLGKITKRDFSEKLDVIFGCYIFVSQDDHTTFSTNQKVDDAKSTIHCFVLFSLTMGKNHIQQQDEQEAIL